MIAFGRKQIGGTQRKELLAPFFRPFTPVRRIGFVQDGLQFCLARLLKEPFAESRYWRQRGVIPDARQVGFQILDNLLDQRTSERDAAQTLLAVRNGVEDRVVSRFRIADGRARVDQRLNPFAHAPGERHFDEYQRLARQRGVKERVTAAVGFETPPQIIPPLDLVDRLVSDQFLQDNR